MIHLPNQFAHCALMGGKRTNYLEKEEAAMNQLQNQKLLMFLNKLSLSVPPFHSLWRWIKIINLD